MNFIIIISVLNILFLGRNIFTFIYRRIGINIISKYCESLIYKRQYNRNINYYEEMLVSYERLIFSFWVWGDKYCAIKPEYKELLSKYME